VDSVQQNSTTFRLLRLDSTMPPSKNITFEELSKYFHVPINQVAKELGVCATILKKICRRNGIPRWPHRKIKSLDKMTSNLEMNLAKNPHERDEITREIETLRGKKKEIMNNPNVLSKNHDNLKGVNKLHRKNLGHRMPAHPKDGSTSEEPLNCFVDSNKNVTSGASYVDLVLNGNSNPLKDPLAISKPQLINTLANMRFDQRGVQPPRRNELSFYSFDIPTNGQNGNSPFPHGLSFMEPIADYSHSLPALKFVDGRREAVFDTYKETSSNLFPCLEPMRDSTELTPQPKIRSLPTNAFPQVATNMAMPSWFEEEKNRILGKPY